MKFKNISIKWKIFMYLLGFCGLLLLILWVFQVIFLDDFYKNIKTKQIEKSAIEIAYNINDKDLLSRLYKISTENDICIEIITKDGTILASSDILKNCIIHHISVKDKLSLFDDAIINGGEMLRYFTKENFFNPLIDLNQYFAKNPKNVMPDQQSIVFAKVITVDNNNALLLLNSVISPVNATVETLRIQLHIISLVMILLAILIAFFIARRVSKPIIDINDSANILATGEYEVQFNGSGYKEINELSETLNYAAKELSKVDRLQKELIANISHDLRTPLTLISGYAEVMRDLPDEINQENISIIIDETNRLSSLVNSVLDISRLQSGTATLNSTEYNITDNIQKTIMRLNDLIKKDGYSIEFIKDRDVIINADETKISQVVYNLLTNAINYTGDDKRIVVKQDIGDGMVTISVSDSGEGIEPKQVPYIWDRYYKVDKVHKRAYTGTGIGLSIVKSVIDLHHGDYGVDSVIGKGSTFWFKLPI